MTRSTSPFPGLTAFLAVAVLACAVGPAAGAVAGELGGSDLSHCERMGHPMPSDMPGEEAPGETPADASTCCVSAPEVSRDAVAPIPPPDVARALAAVLVAVSSAPVEVPRALPPDTGPPPGPRLHLTLSVFLV